MNVPITFDVLAINEPGAPVTLQKKTISSLGADEVLVRVAYASINKMDPALAQRNMFQLPAPYVLGFDFSGEVVQAGSESGYHVGDPVFGRTGRGGCYAEYLVANKTAIRRRGSIPAPEASTYGVAYLTAYESLRIAVDLSSFRGKTIFIPGGAGGVGHFAVQLARLSGLRVIASAGKSSSLALLKALGVEHIVDYSHQDVVTEVLRLTEGRGADLVYDSTYNQVSYDQSSRVVASGGVYVRLGTPPQLERFGVSDVAPIVESRGARLVIGDLGRYANDPVWQAQMPRVDAGLEKAVEWYQTGTLRPVVTQTVPFAADALQKAFEAFLAGTTNVGKVVVVCLR